MVTINLKGILGDDITATVDPEDTNQVTIKFYDSLGGGLKSLDQLPDTVDSMGWYYATQDDLEKAEELYNVDINKKRLWKADEEN